MKAELKYWIVRDTKEMGPYTFDVLLKLWTKGELQITDKVRSDGSEVLNDVSRMVPALERAASSDPEKTGKTWAVAGTILATLGVVLLVWAYVRANSVESALVGGVEHDRAFWATLIMGLVSLPVGIGCISASKKRG